MFKVCSKCGETKQVEEFSNWLGMCKECIKLYNRPPKERLAEIKKKDTAYITNKYYIDNKESLKIKRAIYSFYGTNYKNVSNEEKLILLGVKLLKSKRSFKWQQRVWKLAQKDIDHALEALFKNKITTKENLL